MTKPYQEASPALLAGWAADGDERAMAELALREWAADPSLDRPERPDAPHPACPGCGRVMSLREASEQSACNDCYAARW